MCSEERSSKKVKLSHDNNHQSSNGDVTQPSVTVVTQQPPVMQSTATADVMPAYSYAPTWPGYAVRMPSFCLRYYAVFLSSDKQL